MGCSESAMFCVFKRTPCCVFSNEKCWCGVSEFCTDECVVEYDSYISGYCSVVCKELSYVIDSVVCA